MPCEVVAMLQAEMPPRFRTWMDLASWRNVRIRWLTPSLPVTAIGLAVTGK